MTNSIVTDLALWLAAAVLLSVPVGRLLNTLDDRWQQLEQTRVVLRFDRRKAGAR